jgi:hypothetical protein
MSIPFSGVGEMHLFMGLAKEMFRLGSPNKRAPYTQLIDEFPEATTKWIRMTKHERNKYVY